jgi:hypothetical protein
MKMKIVVVIEEIEELQLQLKKWNWNCCSNWRNWRTSVAIEEIKWNATGIEEMQQQFINSWWVGCFWNGKIKGHTNQVSVAI